jgi:hypothetical protein
VLDYVEALNLETKKEQLPPAPEIPVSLLLIVTDFEKEDSEMMMMICLITEFEMRNYWRKAGIDLLTMMEMWRQT